MCLGGDADKQKSKKSAGTGERKNLPSGRGDARAVDGVGSEPVRNYGLAYESGPDSIMSGGSGGGGASVGRGGVMTAAAGEAPIQDPFQQWQEVVKQAQALKVKLAMGEIDKAAHDAAIAPLNARAKVLREQVETDPGWAVQAREIERQNDVNLGKTHIDESFEQFDDAYYDEYNQSYLDNYIPQLDDQYATAVGKMIARLASRGIDRSSIGAAKQADLFEDYNEAKTTIGSEADAATNALRSNVENTKSNLYQINSASADPANMNAQAAGQAKTLVAPPAYSPLGDVFASAIQPWQNMQSAQNNTPLRQYTSPFARGRDREGSSRVVK